MQSPPEQNLELKARCPNLTAAHEAARALATTGPTVEFQTDTYFRIAEGRLKLREIEGQTAVLIWYDRPNDHDPRFSAYRRAPVADAASVKAVLAGALGVRGEVRKRRTIYLWHNVRIHLDEVAGLGTFLEFEAVLTSGGEPGVARERLAHLCRRLQVAPEDRLAVSYADLLGI
jgi:adenylate cyclase, class 2